MDRRSAGARLVRAAAHRLMLFKRTPGAPLSDAERDQRRAAAKARWEGAAAGAAVGAAAGAGLAAATGWYRSAKAASGLQAGRLSAERITARGEAKVARHAAVKARIERAAASDWPLPVWRRHLGREIRETDRRYADIADAFGPNSAEAKDVAGERGRLWLRRLASGLTRPPRDEARKTGKGFFVAGQTKRKRGGSTVIPERLQRPLDERLVEGWKEPRNKAARQPMAFPTGDDMKLMREEVRSTLGARHQAFSILTRVSAAASADKARAAGFGAARQVLRSLPKMTTPRIAAIGALGALAGGGAAWAARGQVEKLAKRTQGAVPRTPFELEAMAAQALGPRSLAEAEAGTYRKAHIALHGLQMAIETPRGRERIGWAKDGAAKWRAVMPAHYGYIKGTVGADGDHIDVYLTGNALDASRPVFIVEQVKLPARSFDEHKVIIGAEDEAEAVRIYNGGFSDGSGPARRRAILRMDLAEFKAWLGKHAAPALAKVSPTDPTDDGAWERPEPSDEENSSSSASTPTPPKASEDRIARALGRLFDQWARNPRSIGEQGPVEEALKPVQDAFRAGAQAGGSPPNAAAAMGEASGGARTITAAFDARSPTVERHLREYSLDLIREISNSSRDSIRQALQVAAISGAPVEQQARWIRESVGLTAAQAAWVRSFRAQLEAGDERALHRALRDKRYDRTVRRAIATGEPIPAEKLDAMVAAYHRRTLAYRATTIARTEAIRASNMGSVAGMRAMLDANPTMTVEKIWIATDDEKTRDSHRDLNGKVVEGLDAFFTAKGAEGQPVLIRWPHDTDAPASETVNCRCTLGWRLKPRQAIRMVAEAV
jgi:hypothetical protein